MYRILVIDDEEAILLALKKLLTRPCIEVDTSESVEHSIKLIEKNIYNVVIADLRLSGTLGQEGFEIISRVKKVSPRSIIALVTAYGSSDIQQKAASLGADFYFEKPVTVEHLNTIIGSLRTMVTP